MADAGHDMTDALLKETERKVKREYERAYRETQRKLKAYWKDIEGQAAKQRELLTAGKISQKDYNDWMLRHAAMGKRWEDMRDNLAQDYYNYNQISRSIVKGYQPEVYALNHNYATYQVEHSGGIDTAYTLYDKQTVERLIREDQVLMPDPSPRKKAQIARNKAMQWNKQALQSALTQGILQGESIPEIADRIARTVSVRNYNDSVRYARTMFTSAENAGRYDGYRRADKMGVDLTIEWSATLDGRTRHDHRMMHGQRRNVDEPFETPDGYKIYYPADCTGESNAPQSEIWNCRCTLLAWVKGFERDTVKSSPKMGEMSFEEWQHAKDPKKSERVAAPKTTSEANSRGRAILENMYENHRITNNMSSVPAEQLRDMNIIDANYGKMPVEAADVFNNALDDLAKDFDTPLSQVRTMTREEFAMNPNAFAFVRHEYTTDTAMLVINPTKCKDVSALRNRILELAENGYCVKVAPEYAEQYVVTHEFAHTLLNMRDALSNKTNWVNANYDNIRAARKEIENVYARYSNDVGALIQKTKDLELKTILASDIEEAKRFEKLYREADAELSMKKISDYSLADIDEFMAESFTEQRIGQAVNPYAKEVMDILVRHFGRK